MKKYRYYVSIDNGCTGTISVIDTEKGTSSFCKTPVFKCKSYTKKPQNIHRINWGELIANLPKSDALVTLERPLVNPHMFSATQSALRSLEATLIAIEYLGLDYQYMDSKEWQQEFLSSALIGKEQMKEGSKQVAIDLYPNHRTKIEEHGDGDSLLMARYVMLQHEK
jgi:hypothetical protein